MAFTQPSLPFDKKALEPYISEKTFDFHYGKHHLTYINKLNELVDSTSLADHSLETIVAETRDDLQKSGIFNNAAQAWNHTFFWHSLSLKPAGPSGVFAEAIDKSFGNLDNLKEAFAKAAAAQFGSGWAWLVKAGDDSLKILTTANAQTPLGTENTPLLVLDVWEHAYYLDYQNRRPDFIKTFLDHLANWPFAQKNFEEAH